MKKMIATAGVCLMLASGAALAQGTGQGTGTGDGKGNDTGQQNQNSPVRTDNKPATSGITTQSTTPSSTDRPSAEQCRAGWSSSMRWTRAEFDAACR